MGAATRAHPSFGMTPTFQSLTLLTSQIIFSKSWCHTKRRMGAAQFSRDTPHIGRSLTFLGILHILMCIMMRKVKSKMIKNGMKKHRIATIQGYTSIYRVPRKRNNGLLSFDAMNCLNLGHNIFQNRPIHIILGILITIRTDGNIVTQVPSSGLLLFLYFEITILLCLIRSLTGYQYFYQIIIPLLVSRAMLFSLFYYFTSSLRSNTCTLFFFSYLTASMRGSIFSLFSLFYFQYERQYFFHIFRYFISSMRGSTLLTFYTI